MRPETALQWMLCRTNPDFTDTRILLESKEPIASPFVSGDEKTICFWKGVEVARSALSGKRGALMAVNSDGGNPREAQNHALQPYCR